MNKILRLHFLRGNISLFMLFTAIGAVAQTTPTAPYISIVQTQTVPGQPGSSPLSIAEYVNSGPLGSQSSPTRLDFGYPFTIYVDVPQGAYTGQTLFLYMQDSQYGSGAFNNWYWQGTPVSVPAAILSGPTNITLASGAAGSRYTFNMSQGQYPTLMNCQSYWSSLLDGSIIRPTLSVGYTTNASTPAQWGNYVINPIDIWGYKNRLSLVYPTLNNPDVIIEINQYATINQNLEQMLLAGISTNASTGITVPNGAFTLPAGTYSWYMDDEYGVSPYTYLVNDPNPWMNNIYQAGFKPWINSTHIDGNLGLSDLDYWTVSSAGNICYMLIYYVIPSSLVPSGNGYVPSATFNQNAYRVIIKINPYISIITGQPTQPTPPLISSAITIDSQDYGSAAAGTQWGAALSTGQTNYTYAGNYLPGDGQYSIAQDIVGIIGGSTNTRPIDWYVPAGGPYAPAKKYDHTSGDGTGYMYIVNADASGGIFYQNTFNVCPHMNLQASMWLTNICDGTRQNTSYNSSYRIKPNVHVQIYSGSLTTPAGTPLLDYYTGEIPMTGIWEQYFTPVFTVPTGVNQITIFFLSVNNGGDGNDFMMDDVQIQRSNGAFSFSNTNISQCLSASDAYQITATWDTTAVNRIFGTPPPTQLNYQWTFYNTTSLDSISNRTATVPITTNGPSSGTVNYPADTIIVDVPGTQVGIYQITVATTSGGLSNQCATFSYYVFSPQQPPVIDTDQSNLSICPGEVIILSIDTSASNVFNVDSLLWYIQPNGGQEVPLLDSQGNQITGQSVSVTPSQTTTYTAKIASCSTGITYTVNVGSGPSAGFGSTAVQTGYTRRVCYSQDTVNIPIQYASGTGTLNYKVFLDGVGNATPLDSGLLAAVNNQGNIVIPLDSIKPSLCNFRNGMNTVTCAVVIAGIGTNCGRVQYFNIRFISDKSVWVPSLSGALGVNTNWNNDQNWVITDEYGNRYTQAGVPMACTDVVIPGNVTAYPILQANYTGVSNLPTDDGFNPQPQCNSILFQQGGEVAQLQYLQYLYAYVEMNFGTYDSNQSFTNTANLINTDGGNNYYQYFLSRDRYYSMTAPLKEMYAGDFAFAGRPNTYMKYVDSIYVSSFNPGVTLINRWSTSVNSYDVPFPAGFGFAYQVLSGMANYITWPYNANQDYLNNVYGKVTWPYYNDSTYLAELNPRHIYTPSSPYGDGTSEISYYVLSSPMTDFGKSDVMTRSSVVINNTVTGGTNINVPKGNRFIAEDDATNAFPANGIISITPTNNTPNTEILLGNPIMSHIDFGQLYIGNIAPGDTTIGNYCRIWTGSSAQYYSILVDNTGALVANTNLAPYEVEETSTLIAPVQSFLVVHNNTSNINFNLPNVSVTFPDKNISLRSARADKPELLKIIASNSRYSAAASIVNYPDKENLDKGVPKLFSPSGNIPEIYLLQGYKKEIIEINRNVQTIPLGIKTRVTGEFLSLKFYGLDKFSSEVSIYDAQTGITQPLTANRNEFRFLNTEGDQENRFYLLFSSGETTNLDGVTSKNIQVYASDGHIKVSSSPVDPILSVKIYNVQGQLLSRAGNLSAVFYEEKQINAKGVYLVQIKTKQNSTTRKVIIY